MNFINDIVNNLYEYTISNKDKVLDTNKYDYIINFLSSSNIVNDIKKIKKEELTNEKSGEEYLKLMIKINIVKRKIKHIIDYIFA